MRRTVLLAAVLALPTYALADGLQPGKYRVTSQAAGEKPDTSEECVTQKDIDDGLSALGAQKDPSCKVLDMKRSPSSVSYRTVCSANGATVTTRANFAFTRDTLEGVMSFNVGGAGGSKGDSGKIHFVGKRIGACKE